MDKIASVLRSSCCYGTSVDGHLIDAGWLQMQPFMGICHFGKWILLDLVLTMAMVLVPVVVVDIWHLHGMSEISHELCICLVRHGIWVLRVALSHTV